MSNRKKLRGVPDDGFPIELPDTVAGQVEALRRTVAIFARDQETNPHSRHKFYRTPGPPGQQDLLVSEDGGPPRKVTEPEDAKRLIAEEQRARKIPLLYVKRVRHPSSPN